MATVQVTPLTGSNVLADIPIPESFRVLGDGEQVERGGSTRIIKILTPKDGDKRLTWDRNNLAQIEEARQMWDQLLLEGLVPYEIGPDGRSTGRIIEFFDPDIEEVLFAPAASPKAKHGLLVGG